MFDRNSYNISKQQKLFECPNDGIKHFFNLDKISNEIEPTIYPNLKLEIILKEILNINEPTIKEKYIVYAKPEMKRNKSPENINKNILNNNNSDPNLIENNNINSDIKNRDDSNNKKNKNIKIKINSGNQIINVNAINVNIDTREILKKEDKNKNNDLKIDNKPNNNDSLSNDYLNTLQINEEINVNEGKLNFENEKINDDSIETIPLNDEKSMTNMSFKDDFKELLNKNYEFKQISGNMKIDDKNNDKFFNSGTKKKEINDFNNVNDSQNNLKKTMKTI